MDLTNGSSGTVELIADVSGYFSGGGTAANGAFTPVAPTRLLDTRNGTGAPQAPVAAEGTVALSVAGAGGVPATGVSAVVLNVTVTQPTRARPHHRLPGRDDAPHRLEPELLSRRDRPEPRHRPGRF